MFNGPFQEAQTQKCFDDDVDLLVFDLWTQVVYAGEFPEHIRHGRHHSEEVVKFYVLASKYPMDQDILRRALDVVLDLGPAHRLALSFALSPVAVQAALTSLDASHQMGRLVADLVCKDYMTDAIDDDWMGEALEGVPVERAV
jgi:hypothetical protein